MHKAESKLDLKEEGLNEEIRFQSWLKIFDKANRDPLIPAAHFTEFYQNNLAKTDAIQYSTISSTRGLLQDCKPKSITWSWCFQGAVFAALQHVISGPKRRASIGITSPNLMLIMSPGIKTATSCSFHLLFQRTFAFGANRTMRTAANFDHGLPFELPGQWCHDEGCDSWHACSFISVLKFTEFLENFYNFFLESEACQLPRRVLVLLEEENC
ncbi:hypothetical protein VNO77_04290 [Canavalia gladiata]|uniref:Uncharacterized protein n=1 Tax=Canavalia gladiata TaxID=3824 RepID=A0AAN9MYB2_CANGL